MTIWLIGNSREPRIDAHTHAMMEACSRAGVDARFLGPGSDLGAEGRRMASGDVVVWRYKMVPPSYPQTMPGVISRYCAAEWREALHGLCASSGLPVLNGYEVLATAGNKPHQLATAEECGFLVPRHAILSDKTQVLDFVTELGGSLTIRKPLAGYDIPDPSDTSKSVLLSPIIVSRPELETAEEDQFSRCPTLFQEYVDKKHELRVVAVGDAIIPFLVDSQTRERTRVDWRMGILEDMFSLVEIDDNVSTMIRQYLSRMGLFSGVFDFIVRPDGGTVFLECNPNGQWMWLDYLMPNQLADTFVREVRKFQQAQAFPDLPFGESLMSLTDQASGAHLE